MLRRIRAKPTLLLTGIQLLFKGVDHIGRECLALVPDIDELLDLLLQDDMGVSLRSTMILSTKISTNGCTNMV